MSGFEADPAAMLALSMRQALAGSHALATQTLERALTLDRDGVLSDTDVELARCVIALVRRDPILAREHAATACQTAYGRDSLGKLLSLNREELPSGALRLLGEFADKPALQSRHIELRWYRRWPAVAVFGLVVVTGLSALAFVFYSQVKAGSAHTERQAAPMLNESATRSPQGVPTERLEQLVGLVVVEIRAQWSGGPVRRVPIATGTAFTVSQDGLLITSQHVFEDYLKIEPSEESESGLRRLGCELLVAFGPNARDRYEARVVHSSSYLDLAVLRIERHTDDYLRFSLEASQGEEVISAGFPAVASELFDSINREAGMARTATILDMLERRELPELDDWLSADHYTQSVFRGNISAIRKTEQGRFVQTDAKMYPGMSGGPLLNQNMEVVGVITLGHSLVEGINAALAASSIRDDIREITAISWP